MNTQPIEAVLPALLADAARRSGAAPAQLRVTAVEAVTWPDSSLGCPRPGMLAMQVLTPGWRVRIAAPASPELLYHLGPRATWLHCPADRAQPALPGGAGRGAE